MKIGIFTYDFYPFEGGQGRHLFELYQRIYKSKQFIIFSPCKNKFEDHLQIFGWTKKIGKNILLSFLLNFQINQLIKKYNLKIVHFHCGPGGIILIRKPKAKMICTVHHTYFQQQKFVPGQKWKKIFYYLEKLMYQKADKIICVSQDTASVLKKEYQIKKSKTAVIPNGVNLSYFEPLKNIKKESKGLIFVGRLDKRKGIDWLIEAVPLIKRKIPRVKLFVAGGGKFRNELEKEVVNHKLEKNIVFLGFIRDEELSEWYNRAEATIIPSVFEGFGIIAIESMACGTPVLATNVQGIREIIDDGKNGILVNYGNKKALAEKAIKLLKNKSLRDKLTKEGLKTAKKYDWERISQKTLTIYQ